MTGNFLGDFCTSRQIEKLPENMQKGIALHREIDAFTDASEEFIQLVNLLRPTQGKYSPVVADIIWDHYLAASGFYFEENELERFARHCYRVLLSHKDFMPPKALRFLNFAVEVNVFEAYATLNGVQKVFDGMSGRAAFDNNMPWAVDDIKSHYVQFEGLFQSFFPRLIHRCEEVRGKMILE